MDILQLVKLTAAVAPAKLQNGPLGALSGSLHRYVADRRTHLLAFHYGLGEGKQKRAPIWAPFLSVFAGANYSMIFDTTPA
ncbi:hypothetical protein, partial [Ruegeria arenilitoris]|uniref:hypothetical protein n=1 Tax=Ruegeria arenilitoris TaxID=1173585 RepID=UPI001C2BD3B8